MRAAPEGCFQLRPVPEPIHGGGSEWISLTGISWGQTILAMSASG
jgi:hypothetical protein